jgi:hypothetical protein
MLVKPTPHISVESVTLDENSIELDSGSEYQLLVEVLPEGADQRVT